MAGMSFEEMFLEEFSPIDGNFEEEVSWTKVAENPVKHATHMAQALHEGLKYYNNEVANNRRLRQENEALKKQIQNLKTKTPPAVVDEQQVAAKRRDLQKAAKKAATARKAKESAKAYYKSKQAAFRKRKNGGRLSPKEKKLAGYYAKDLARMRRQKASEAHKLRTQAVLDDMK